ncbi:diacylglycerol/lipid kinase family protein [Legionella bononiensis]|uniref:Diacylglycerol kinase family lipid kinase n=1 Tax=Legionella bononiensis TaxID=2793102 RepID=A0ABS1WAW4_9GAMM|nr:diacylglycerol kinase family protein [Legionella bononiensis]MBL7480263.1 diacylglycerol kinase family lipid kinase [Legionella bononiensis]MBL7526505.1 diacylglycerol kinase family lipid kinase [Legionella bononiensis]MBL7563001.1 diacylglycerol kinase family lipid kinase [Legionella bononiensis]
MSSLAVVINPESGGGRGKKIWLKVQSGLNTLFDKMTYRISACGDELTPLTQELLSDKPDYLLIIGGDGTLSYAINGIIKQDKIEIQKTKIAYFNAGCGGDFIRQFPKQDIIQFLDRLKNNQFVNCNIGKINFIDQPPHYFINIASCGLSGQVVSTVSNSRWFKKVGGSVNYFLHSLVALFTYKRSPVRIQIDDASFFDCSLLLLAACNGQFFGGGMHVAPKAKLDDGLIDVVLFGDFTTFNALLKLPEIYSGTHILDKNVQYVQAKKITIEPKDNSIIHVEADGESIGHLPATFELLEDTFALIV